MFSGSPPKADLLVCALMSTRPRYGLCGIRGRRPAADPGSRERGIASVRDLTVIVSRRRVADRDDDLVNFVAHSCMPAHYRDSCPLLVPKLCYDASMLSLCDPGEAAESLHRPAYSRSSVTGGSVARPVIKKSGTNVRSSLCLTHI